MTEQRREYLTEHLPYMLKMLRYTYSRITSETYYLAWNAHLESFAVHARSLTMFLTNNDKGNFGAKDFARDYRARIGDLGGLMRKLNEQVFHLAKDRPTESARKFSAAHAAKVFEWVERNFVEFLSAVSPELSGLFPEDRANPAKDPVLHITLGPTGGRPTASSADPIVITKSMDR